MDEELYCLFRQVTNKAIEIYSKHIFTKLTHFKYHESLQRLALNMYDLMVMVKQNKRNCQNTMKEPIIPQMKEQSLLSKQVDR